MGKIRDLLNDVLKYILIGAIAIASSYLIVDEFYASKDEIADDLYSRQEFSDGHYYADISFSSDERKEYFIDADVLIEGDQVKSILIDDTIFAAGFSKQKRIKNNFTAIRGNGLFEIEVKEAR